MRTHPSCNLDHLTEVSFEFDQGGKIIDCIGTIKDGGNIDHDYAGSGLARLYEKARHQFTARQTSETIFQFPNGERLANAYAIEPACQLSAHPLNNRCASRVGLTPSPTCLPGQGGSRKGMRPFGNETGRASVSPSRSNRWRVF